MKQKLTCILMISALLLVSCGKKEVKAPSATDNTSISTETNETTDEVVDSNEPEPEIKPVDISADVTPEDVVAAEDTGEILGKIKITRARPAQNYLTNGTGNLIHITFTATRSSNSPIALYIDGESNSSLGEMPIVEAGKTYEFEFLRKVENYDSISAYVEADGIKSNTATIYAYDKLTSENAEVAYNNIKSFEADTDDLMSDGYISESNIPEALNRIEKAANAQKENGDILEVVRNERHVYIRFKSGIEYIYAPPVNGSKASGKQVSIHTYQPFAAPGKPKSLPSEQMDSAAEYIDDAFEDIVFSQNFDDDRVNMDTIIENFSRNQIIIWDGHGDYDEQVGAFLLTGDIWNGYPNNYLVGKGCLLTNGGTFCVGDEFFDFWFDQSSLDNSFIILNTCCSAISDDNHSLLWMLKDKGASAVIGFDNYVKISYANNFVDYVLKKMCEIDNSTSDYYTAYNASCYGIGVYGKDDADFDPAQPIYCGDVDYRFSTAIENLNNVILPDGVYDAALGIFGKNKDDSFKLYGDTVGNLYNARIDINSKTLVLESGFLHEEDPSNIIPYDIYELPLSSDYKLEAGTGDGPMSYSPEDFNDLFYNNSMSEWNLGFGFSIWVENGVVNRILCWGS